MTDRQQCLMTSDRRGRTDHRHRGVASGHSRLMTNDRRSRTDNLQRHMTDGKHRVVADHWRRRTMQLHRWALSRDRRVANNNVCRTRHDRHGRWWTDRREVSNRAGRQQRRPEASADGWDRPGRSGAQRRCPGEMGGGDRAAQEVRLRRMRGDRPIVERCVGGNPKDRAAIVRQRLAVADRVVRNVHIARKIEIQPYAGRFRIGTVTRVPEELRRALWGLGRVRSQGLDQRMQFDLGRSFLLGHSWFLSAASSRMNLPQEPHDLTCASHGQEGQQFSDVGSYRKEGPRSGRRNSCLVTLT